MLLQRVVATGFMASKWFSNGRTDLTDRHVSTYAAHPVACAASLAVQDVIEEDNLLANVRAQGAYLKKVLREKISACKLASKHVAEVRGKGLMLGMQVLLVASSSR
jgi:adenosylmethionine-8-amino-7-oxononanoate aminotransferase